MWSALVAYGRFIYLGFYVAFNTVQVISRRVVGRAEETSTFSSSGFCTVNCRPTASNYQLSHLRPCREPNPGLRGGRRVLPLCHHSPLLMEDDTRLNKQGNKCSHTPLAVLKSELILIIFLDIWAFNVQNKTKKTKTIRYKLL